MLQEVEVGGYNLPENVLRRITEAEGKYLTADVYAGDYICLLYTSTSERFS